MRHTFIDLGEFISEHSALIARAYEQSGAARWGLSLDKFASAVHVSISACREAPEQTVLSLRWSDLALAAACRAGIEKAWEEFIRLYRPLLYTAACAIVGDDLRGRELADSLYADLYGMGVRQGRGSLLDHFHVVALWRLGFVPCWPSRHVDYLRESRRSEALAQRVDQPGPVTVEPPDGERQRDLRAIGAAVESALSALEPRDRMRLAYYYRHGLKLREIAASWERANRACRGTSHASAGRCAARSSAHWSRNIN